MPRQQLADEAVGAVSSTLSTGSSDSRRKADNDDQEWEDKVTISPLDNVYSYLMFVLPIEAYKYSGKPTWTIFTAYSMVFVALFFQGTILYAIWNAVVVDDIEWREGIMGPGPYPNEEKCNHGGSLCSLSNGTFSCAPPSVQLAGRWDELDTNGDGIWTHEEVLESREKLMCKYVVDPAEVFDVFVKFMLNREDLIWIHPDLRAGKSIHKMYFTYAAGDIIMCGYRSQEMCANLMRRGVFDAPLEYGTAPRVGKTIDSALDYCYALLEPGGVCERTLPSTYSVWKKSSVDQCLGTEFRKYVYEHPTNGQKKSLLEVDYGGTKSYKQAAGNRLFVVFKGIIIFTFLLALWMEFKDISSCASWVLYFPSVSECADHEEVVRKDLSDAGEGDEASGWVIQGTSAWHRLVNGAIVILRFCIIATLAIVGITFLQKDTDWVNLLLNAVALVFVLEIDQNLFTQVIHTEFQERFMATEPMIVRRLGLPCLNKRPALKDMLGFICIVCVLVVLMYSHHALVNVPLSSALECACLSQGDHCREAHTFSKSFWDDYWVKDVPAVFDEVEELKATVPEESHDDDGTSSHTVLSARQHHRGWHPGKPRHERMLNRNRHAKLRGFPP